VKKVIDKLKSYINLPVDYDGYGGHPPSETTISNMIEVINKLPSNIKTPVPMCGRDSTAIYWEFDNHYIEISVYEDGEVDSFISNDLEEDRVGTVDNPNISNKLIKLITL
jgi:hypothetical protein